MLSCFTIVVSFLVRKLDASQRFTTNQDVYVRSMSCLNSCRLSIAFRLRLRLKRYRMSPTRQSGTHSLSAQSQTASLFNDGLVNRQWRPVDLNDILGIRCGPRVIGQERQQSQRTFSRSILASEPMRVSRIRFTIHFSPSSRDRLSRSDRSLDKATIRSTLIKDRSTYDAPNIDSLVNAAICLTDQVSRIIQEFFPVFVQEEVVRDDSLR